MTNRRMLLSSLPATRLNSAIWAASPAALTRSPVSTTNAGFRRLAVATANSKLAVSCSNPLFSAYIPNCGSDIWINVCAASVAANASANRIRRTIRSSYDVFAAIHVDGVAGQPVGGRVAQRRDRSRHVFRHGEPLVRIALARDLQQLLVVGNRARRGGVGRARQYGVGGDAGRRQLQRQRPGVRLDDGLGRAHRAVIRNGSRAPARRHGENAPAPAPVEETL